MTLMKRYEVQDRDRKFTFDGVMLGHASSRSNGKRRWSEVSIYRTQAGTYIVSGIGQTLIRKGEWYWDDDAQASVRAQADETSRCWAHVCDTAEGAIQCLYLYDGDGVRYMTYVVREALAKAIACDDMLKEAYAVEEVA